MKILAFVDLHGDKNALNEVVEKGKKADVILCAGDISVFEAHMDKILDKLNQIGKPVLMIHGNHEMKEQLKDMCMDLENIVFLHRGLYEKDGVSFIGFGGGGFSRMDEEFEEFVAKVKPHLKKKIVLMTHGPPFETNLDSLYDSNTGNKSYRRFIEKYQPLLAVSGHIHETAGAVDTIGKTYLINPGKKGRILKI